MAMSISDSMDRLLDRFDEAWNDPTPPRIEDYLAKANPDKRLALLIELVRIDLERRLAAGEKVRLEETYLRRFPELSGDPPAIVALIKHEYAVRRRNDPQLTLTEYRERFPQCQTDLLAQPETVDEICQEVRQAKPADAPAGLDLRGYELTETLGKGGMGEVYRCVDPALGRDLAIKIIKAEYSSHAVAAGRFLREARVTGSLQHPGIVPIHNLGRLSDGRLHYTMRLVRGRTFAGILTDEAGEPERLPYLLSIFERICQAVAYAHSKRVIHRDLKPHNVMVGAFGEVQVMDWGLAKVLTPGERGCVSALSETDAAGTRIVTETDTPSDLSRMGLGMGTPAYMPPEQAFGEWDTVDERADVFALGSILCAILTGQPAYSGTDGEEVYRRAKRGDLAEALQRLQQCGADAALTALCRECLSLAREDRPRDAAVVAKRVAAYQAEVQERLRRAEVERAEAQLKAREGRKQRRLLIALLLALLAGAALSTWQAVRATLAESKALTERDEKEIARGEAQAAAEKEGQAKDLAQTRLGPIDKANEALASIFGDLNPRAEEQGGPDLRQQLSQHLERAARQLDEIAIGDAVTVARLQTTLGYSLTDLGKAKVAIELLSKAGRTLEAKLSSDHPHTLASRNNLAKAYSSAGRTAEAIRLHEQTLKQREAKLGPDHPDTLGSMANLGIAYRDVGRMKEAISLFEEALERGRKSSRGFPFQLAWVPGALAETYERAGQFAKAESIYHDLLEKTRQKFGSEDPRTAGQMAALAFNLLRQHKYTDAEPLLRACLKVRESKQPDDWNTFNARSLLGAALFGQKKYTEAEPLLLQGYEGMKAREVKIPPEGKVRLTEALQRLVQLYEATEQKDKAADWRKKLQETKAAPKKPKS